MPAHVRQLLGEYEQLRGNGRPASAALATPARPRCPA